MRIHNMFFVLSICAASIITITTNAELISPVNVDSSQGNTFNSGAFPATNLINGGLNLHDHSPGEQSNWALTGNWVTNQAGSNYFSAGQTPVLIFDMGSNTDIAQIAYWAYSIGPWQSPGATQNNSLKGFSLKFATENEGANQFGKSIAFNPILTAEPALPSNSNARGLPQPMQTLDLDQTVNARYIQMTLLSNYYGAPGGLGGDRVGFNEIAFNTVPEPTSLGLIALASLILLKRK